MAGGVGSRFWPMSRSSFPKQFHDILGGGQTLLQLTAERFNNLCPKENIYIVTNNNYKKIVEQQLPFLNASQILLEPDRKNTAPCIAYAAFKIKSKNSNARLIIAPSDHIIVKQEEFEKTIRAAIDKAITGDHLITLGIKPNRPDTGYGYIQFEETISKETVKKVVSFTEKPKKEIALKFLESGNYYWNSGMFVWSVDSIINALKIHLPNLYTLFHDSNSAFFTDQETTLINNIYAKCQSISIDNGVMEKATNTLVVLADLGWSDLGTWSSLFDHLKKDSDNNATIGNKIMTYDSNNNIILAPKDKIVVVQGVSDSIIVENNGALLICKKEDEQQIKMIVEDISKNLGEEYT